VIASRRTLCACDFIFIIEYFSYTCTYSCVV